MPDRLSSRIWKLLGGSVDAQGEPTPAHDDPVVVFQGLPEDARTLRSELEAEGIGVQANARVADPRPVAVDLGTSARPATVALEVRAADEARARLIVDRPRTLGD